MMTIAQQNILLGIIEQRDAADGTFNISDRVINNARILVDRIGSDNLGIYPTYDNCIELSLKYQDPIFKIEEMYTPSRLVIVVSDKSIVVKMLSVDHSVVFEQTYDPDEVFSIPLDPSEVQ